MAGPSCDALRSSFWFAKACRVAVKQRYCSGCRRAGTSLALDRANELVAAAAAVFAVTSVTAGRSAAALGSP